MGQKVFIFAGEAKSLINFRGHLIKSMLRRGHSVTACTANTSTSVAREVESMGVTLSQIAFSRAKGSVFGELRSLVQLIKVIRSSQPDVIFVYTIKSVLTLSLASRFLFWRRKVRSYALITGLGFLFIDQRIRTRVLRAFIVYCMPWLFRSFEKVFFQNNDDLQLFLNLRAVTEAQVRLVDGSGVDLSLFRYLPVSANKPDLVFLMVARLLIDKGVREFIEAARQLKLDISDHKIKFQLLGPLDKNPNSIGTDELDRLKDEGVVEYLGTTNDVRPFLSVCDVFVLPSYREGLPRSTLEALAIGRAVVTTDAPGCRETVIDGKNGFLVPPRDVESLCKAFKKFAADRALVAEFGSESRMLVEKRFDVRKINDYMLSEMEL